jgi:hypothetical protein
MTPPASSSTAAQLRAFGEDAKKLVSDPLGVDARAAWRLCYADRPPPRGIVSAWAQMQRAEAARRALKIAGRVGLALESVEDADDCRRRYLALHEQQVQDAVAFAYLRHLRPGQWRQLVAEVAELLPQANVPGYRAIVEEAERIGWPTHFTVDLTDSDLNVLCSPGAPQVFWWGIRSTGTDLFLPDHLHSVQWALARASTYLTFDEQRYYAYSAKGLRPITREQMIAQLVSSLDLTTYEQDLHAASEAEFQAKLARLRGPEAQVAYQQALSASRRAREACRQVKELKQRYA